MFDSLKLENIRKERDFSDLRNDPTDLRPLLVLGLIIFIIILI